MVLTHARTHARTRTHAHTHTHTHTYARNIEHTSTQREHTTAHAHTQTHPHTHTHRRPYVYCSYIRSSADFDLSDNASALNSTCQQFSVPSYMGSLTLVSCVLSMIGSVLTMLTFCIWKDFRTVGRAILVFLAIADFFTAFGYMFGVSVTWAHDDSILKFNGTAYGAACTAQSFLTSFFPVSSFIWTFNLAVYLFAVIVIKTESRTTLRKMFVLFHLAAWGIPTLVCIIGVGFHMFGPSSSLTSVDWCFIRYDNATARFKFFLFEALCGKFWEICTYIASLVMYIVVKWNMKKVRLV